MVREPTLYELKRFWEWCGFVFSEYHYGSYEWWTHIRPEDAHRHRENCQEYAGFPALDFNNLFRYAIPKLEGRYKIEATIDNPDRDSTLDLFWAIWEVIKDE